MSLLLKDPPPALAVPLMRTPEGSIRVTGTRVGLASIIWEHRRGANPKQIVESFPTLTLAQVHAVLAYYLSNRDAVDGWIAEQEAEYERQRGAWIAAGGHAHLTERIEAHRRKADADAAPAV